MPADKAPSESVSGRIDSVITVHIRSERERSIKALHGMSSGYCLPQRMPTEQHGFSCLAAIDESVIDPGIVFERHSHRDIEILTYIVDGILDYRDESNNRLMLLGGEVQVIGAGKGVTHSESNASHSEPLHVVQAWIRPRRAEIGPGHYEQRYFSDDAKMDQLCLIASADARDGSLAISQDTSVYAAVLRHEEPVLFQRVDRRCVWVQVARGTLTVNNVTLGPGDSAAIDGDDDASLRFQSDEEAEFLLFDLP